MNLPFRIDDYGLIGDGRSAALVSRGGSIDWLCWPRFDSAAVFAAVLDPDKGGTFRVASATPSRVTRRYLEGTNVLCTSFASRTGTLRVTDFMPVSSEEAKKTALFAEHEIVRIIECEAGEVDVEIAFAPRPGYARRRASLRAHPTLGVRLEQGRDLYTLRSDAPLELRDSGTAVARFSLRAGERRHACLTYDRDGPAVLPPIAPRCQEALERTLAFWRAWTARSTYDGPYRDAIERSVLALKLLSFAPSGAIVAAPTTSLPERVGGDLNWDYRFCWLRDASLTVRALLDLGYEEDASAFTSWLLHTTRLTRPELRVLYDVYGELPKGEHELSHLAGYGGSRPVRTRNAATQQLQLDVYGEVIDAVAHLVRRGARLDGETQEMLRDFGAYVFENWRSPDQGIWEPRDAPVHHTHSRVLCWVALDRLRELSARGALPKIPVDRFERAWTDIRAEVEARAFNPWIQSYTQVLGGATVDAALLLMSWYGFAEPWAPRMLSTYRRVCDRLEVAPGLFYRYEESRAKKEGAFGICCFWAVEHLARGGGALSDAEQRLQQLLGYANDLGLFAEEIDPVTGEALGNFPQAFTHVGLISAALALEERRRRAGEQASVRAASGRLDTSPRVHA